jgi:hypothetical protein
MMAERVSQSKLVGLITAVLVLIGGFYILIFLPSGLSLLARLIIGLLIILYFMLRMKMIFTRKTGKGDDARAVKPWE